jgi:hypothetical protein
MKCVNTGVKGKKRCPATRHKGAWGERRYSSYSYLTLATRWGTVVSVTPWPRFIPGERTPGTHWIGGWVGLRAGLDTGARRKILCSCRGSNLDHPEHWGALVFKAKGCNVHNCCSYPSFFHP